MSSEKFLNVIYEAFPVMCVSKRQTPSNCSPRAKTFLHFMLNSVAEGAHLHQNLDSLLKFFTVQKTSIFQSSFPSQEVVCCQRKHTAAPSCLPSPLPGTKLGHSRGRAQSDLQPPASKTSGITTDSCRTPPGFAGAHKRRVHRSRERNLFLPRITRRLKVPRAVCAIHDVTGGALQHVTRSSFVIWWLG